MYKHARSKGGGSNPINPLGPFPSLCITPVMTCSGLGEHLVEAIVLLRGYAVVFACLCWVGGCLSWQFPVLEWGG